MQKVFTVKSSRNGIDTSNFIQVESAKSGRSECRKCKTKIEKGELRLAICYDDGIMTSTPWRHINCFFLTKTYIDARIDPTDIKGFEDLNEVQKIQISERIQKLVNGEIGQKSAKKKGEDKYKPQEDISLYKQGGYSEQERKQFYQYIEEYGKMTLPELKAMLLYNQQPKTGTKQEVLERVADGWLLGSIPKCLHCQQGHLAFNRYNGKYSCKGYYDEDKSHFVKCNKKFQRDQIQREEFA